MLAVSGWRLVKQPGERDTPCLGFLPNRQPLSAHPLSLGIHVLPALQTAGLQVRFGGGLPSGRAGGLEREPDRALLVGVGDAAGFVAPEPEAQAAFLGVVDLPMVEEGVEGTLESADFLPGVGVGRGLFLRGVRAIAEVEALLGQAQSARPTLEGKFRGRELARHHLEVLEGHLRRRVVEGHFI